MNNATTNATREPTPELPKYCYARGNRIWARTKDETGKWVNRRTDFTLDTPAQIEAAGRYVYALMQGAAARLLLQKDVTFPKSRKLSAYIEHWLGEREVRGIGSVIDDRCRLEKYVVPQIGDLDVEEVRPRHVRDLVRALVALRRAGELAPRTVVHIYRALHNVYESAVVDEIVLVNPVQVEPGELPRKVDADPEWRMLACFEVFEVERLLTDSIIPRARRVMYALKSLAGLRHGEAAALCWRHYDAGMQPLGRLRIVQSYCSRYERLKATKTEETRAVPVHPALAKILREWRAAWSRVYGREPSGDDFVVPTSDLICVNVRVAVAAMRDDLAALGLRIEAGDRRNRGGHDLRAWFKTRTIEDGASETIIRRTTHAAPKDTDGGYERFTWAAICREVAKLQIGLAGESPTPITTPSPAAEPDEVAPRHVTVPMTTSFAGALERAARRGDLPRVLAIADELRSYRVA